MNGTGKFRWAICALLFFACTVNYMDRQVLGLLKPALSEKFAWAETDYSRMAIFFQAAYAAGQMLFGPFINWIGTKSAYACSVLFWSLSAMSHALCRTVAGFCGARFALGLGESGNFPAAIRVVTEWFPPKERSVATGIFNTGSNMGAIFAPVLVPLIVSLLGGWQAAFITLGCADLVWLGFWLKFYDPPEKSSRVSTTELAHIQAGVAPAAEAKIPWGRLLRYREAWAYYGTCVLVGPVWWFYGFWLPDFFNKQFHLDLKHFGPPLVVVYVVTALGSIGGGSLSALLLKRGWPLNRARKSATLLFACCTLPVIFAPRVESRMRPFRNSMQKTARSACFVLSLACTTATAGVALPSLNTNNVICITNAFFGAVGDGATTNTIPIQKAIDAAAVGGTTNGLSGGVVEIPAGDYLSGPLNLSNSVNLRLEAGAILRMLPLEKYPGGTVFPKSFLTASGLHDLAITGSGAIDGQGSPWWPFAKTRDARRPRMISFSSCERVLIEDVTLSNSPMFHIAISGNSSDVTVRRVTVRANSSTDPVNPSHNTDACDVTGHRILIQDCDISVGDDNYTCGGGTSDVLITNCTYGYGHGVSIGSPTRGGISNLTVINCTFNNTDQGVRIKTDRDRGGEVQKLSYQNLRMTNVGFPILIYCSYMATNREYRALNDLTPAIAATYPSSKITARTPAYHDIVFSNITASARPGRRAGLIWGLPESPVTNVQLERVNITADKPFGIFDARNIRLKETRIITPEGTNLIASTNAQITIEPH